MKKYSRPQDGTRISRTVQDRFPGSKQVILKCLNCEVENLLWTHLEHQWPTICKFCGGKLRKK